MPRITVQRLEVWERFVLSAALKRGRVAVLLVLLPLLMAWHSYGSQATPLAIDPSATWKAVAPAPLGRFEAQGVSANGKLYVFGGFYTGDIEATTRADMYDPASNTWTRLADVPEPLTHTPVVVDEQTLYLIGGFVGDNPGPSTPHVWKYDIPTNTWSAGPDLPVPLGAGGAVIVGRSLHVFGGTYRPDRSRLGEDKPDHYVLNLDIGTSWTTAAPLPNPRNHVGTAALNGKIYAIGGQHGIDEARSNQQQVDVYDPASDTWTRAANLPVPRGHTSASTFVHQNRIFVIGGTVNGGSNGLPSADVLAYDPATNRWNTLPSIPEARKSPVAGPIGNQIIVATGNKGGSQPMPTAWIAQFTGAEIVAPPLPIKQHLPLGLK